MNFLNGTINESNYSRDGKFGKADWDFVEKPRLWTTNYPNPSIIHKWLDFGAWIFSVQLLDAEKEWTPQSFVIHFWLVLNGMRTNMSMSINASCGTVTHTAKVSQHIICSAHSFFIFSDVLPPTHSTESWISTLKLIPPSLGTRIVSGVTVHCYSPLSVWIEKRPPEKLRCQILFYFFFSVSDTLILGIGCSRKPTPPIYFFYFLFEFVSCVIRPWVLQRNTCLDYYRFCILCSTLERNTSPFYFYSFCIFAGHLYCPEDWNYEQTLWKLIFSKLVTWKKFILRFCCWVFDCWSSF